MYKEALKTEVFFVCRKSHVTLIQNATEVQIVFDVEFESNDSEFIANLVHNIVPSGFKFEYSLFKRIVIMHKQYHELCESK